MRSRCSRVASDSRCLHLTRVRDGFVDSSYRLITLYSQVNGGFYQSYLDLWRRELMQVRAASERSLLGVMLDLTAPIDLWIHVYGSVYAAGASRPDRRQEEHQRLPNVTRGASVLSASLIATSATDSSTSKPAVR